MTATADRPRVTLPQGTVVGIRETGEYPGTIEAWKGIPYCLPPTGDRRFRPPVRLPASNDVLDASRFGARAYARQFIVIGEQLPESEDCLTANIFRQEGTVPQDGSNKLLPVALYMHGGAFNRGNAAMHNTAAMVGWSAEPFVAVSFNYRIGALGFLPSALSHEEGALNLGLKDQILMMEWVQENIHHFGGDKNDVTLFGLSAGAHSIGHHLLNHHASEKPLFNRVLIESGSPTSRAVRTYNSTIHEQQFQDFLTACSIPTSMPKTEIFPKLRSLPVETIAAAQTKVFYEYNASLRWAFQPVIDGEIIQRAPLDTWKQGRWHQNVAIMQGFASNEGSLYVDKKMSKSEEFISFWKTLLPQLSDEEDIPKIEELYPDPATHRGSKYDDVARRDLIEKGVIGEQYKRIEAAYAQYAYISPVKQTAYLATTRDGNGGERGEGQVVTPVYLFHWALESDVIGGAKHADNMFHEMRDPARRGKSVTMDAIGAVHHAYVTSFICCKGDPNGIRGMKEGSVVDESVKVAVRERPVWERYRDGEEGGECLMRFGERNKELVGGKFEGPHAEMVNVRDERAESEFWWSKVPISSL